MRWALASSPWWGLAAGMLVDELHFHRRRGLPRWERLGHPIDTAGMLICLALPLLAPLTRAWLAVFGAAALVSMALVTKDESVHATNCRPGELRLHAALFMLHPLALLAALAAWLAPTAALAPLGLGADEAGPLRLALGAQVALTVLFLSYQVVYWNVLCDKAPGSTTGSTSS